MTEREQFEAWARNNGLIYESHGLLSVSSSLELFWKVWQAARAQPAQAGAEPVAWRNAAIRVGEDLCSVGPYGYYDMTADQWLDWALSVVTVHAPARVPLTDEELRMISKQQDPVVVLHHNVLAFAHAIIAAYEAKNGIGGGK